MDPEKNAQGETIFPYSSADRLNDCEKYLLGGNRHSFSSNTNFIPDFYAIKQGLPYMPGTEGSLSGDLFGDGLTNYEKAKLGLPLFVPKSHVPKNFRTRKTTLVNVTRPEEEEGVECYEVRVENIAVTSTEDEIEVMIIQNSAVIEDRALLKKASRSLSGYGEIKFTREDFK